MRQPAGRVIAFLLGCLVLPGLLLAGGCGTDAGPSRLRIMVPNVPGGGYDVTARTAAAVAQRAGLAGPGIGVFNVDGEGGTVALHRLLAERGNGELTMMMGLGVVGATVTRPGGDRVTAATPIARLLEEPQAVLVPAASPYRSVGDLVAAWRADPGAVAFGGGSATGGPDHLMSMALAVAAGIDPAHVRYRAFDGGGDLLPALLDGQIAVGVSGVVEFAAQVGSGQLRVLAVSGATRSAGVDAPTLTEAGLDVEFVNWRGVLAPPGISAADRDHLVRLWQELTRTPEWAAAAQRTGWTTAFLPGDAFGGFLAEQDAQVRVALARLGLP